MDLLLKNMGFQIYSWADCVFEVKAQYHLPPFTVECLLKNNESVIVVELKNISLLKEEEVKRFFNFTKISSKSFLRLKYVLSKDQNFYFCFEKSDRNLMDYLRTEHFQFEKRLLLYKQALELIRTMIGLEDSFAEFDQCNFFVKEIIHDGYSFPHLQLLYHAELITKGTTSSANSLLSDSWYYWAFYLHFIIFQDYSLNPQPELKLNLSKNIPPELYTISDILFKSIASKQLVLTVEEVIEIYNNTLRQFNLEPIFPVVNNRDILSSYSNLDQLLNFNSALKTVPNYNPASEYILNTLMGNMTNFPLNSHYNPNNLSSPSFKFNNNLINPQINHHHYFQFIQNNNIGNLQIPWPTMSPNLINEQNLFMQFYLKNKNSFLPWLNAFENANLTSSNTTRVTNLINNNKYNRSRNFNLSNLSDKVQVNKSQTIFQLDQSQQQESIIRLPSRNDAVIQIKKVNDVPTSFEIIVDKRILSLSNDDSNIEAFSSNRLMKRKKKRYSSDEDNNDEDFLLKNSNDYSYCPEKSRTYNNYEENELELINKINYPRKLRANRMIKKSDIFNQQCSIKTQVAEFQPKYQECLKRMLECKRHKFMHDHFPSMYEIENFYLHIHEMSAKRSNKINILVDIQPFSKSQIAECLKSRKVWTSDSVDRENVNKYIELANKHWPIDNYLYSEEYALEFLMLMNNDINEAIDSFKNKKHILLDFLNNKGINRKQVEPVSETIDKKSRRIRLSKIKNSTTI